jgi:hypothetical protein
MKRSSLRAIRHQPLALGHRAAGTIAMFTKIRGR